MMKNTEGVSSVIGAVLMISLVVVAVAVISVMLLSQPTAEEIPELSVIAGVNPIANKFTIFHEGGDALTLGTFSLMLNSGSGYEDKTGDFTLVGGGELWSIGEYMTYDYGAGSPPVGLKIVYHGKSGDMLLTSAPIAYSGNVTAVGGDTDIGLSEVVPVEDIPEWYATNTSQTSVMYYLGEGDADFTPYRSFKFTVTGEGSTYTVNDKVNRSILPGQTMEIVLNTLHGPAHYYEIFVYGIGNMLYNMRFYPVTIYIDDELVTYKQGWWTYTADNLVYCQITGYDPNSVTSTLEAEVDEWVYYRVLRINGSLIYERDDGNEYIKLTNMKPCSTGAFLINSPGDWDGFDFLGEAGVTY